MYTVRWSPVTRKNFIFWCASSSWFIKTSSLNWESLIQKREVPQRVSVFRLKPCNPSLSRWSFLFRFSYLSDIRLLCDFNGVNVTSVVNILCLAHPRKMSIVSTFKCQSKPCNTIPYVMSRSTSSTCWILFMFEVLRRVLTGVVHAGPSEHWYETIWGNFLETFFMG